MISSESFSNHRPSFSAAPQGHRASYSAAPGGPRTSYNAAPGGHRPSYSIVPLPTAYDTDSIPNGLGDR